MDLSSIDLSEDEIQGICQIYIVVCGSAWYVGMVDQYVIEDLTRIPVRVELASEFRYRRSILDPDGLVIVRRQIVWQYGGMQEPWSLSDGADESWQLRNGRYGRVRGICAEDG